MGKGIENKTMELYTWVLPVFLAYSSLKWYHFLIGKNKGHIQTNILILFWNSVSNHSKLRINISQ